MSSSTARSPAIFLFLFLFAITCILEPCRSDAEGSPPANAPLYTGIITQLQEAEFDYQGQARSERDLETCISDGSGHIPACSIVQQRFWQSPLVYRLCRCPDRQECPWRWSPNLSSINMSSSTTTIDLDLEGELPGTLKSIIHTRDRTMSLNNRAQLKFCQNVRKMSTCTGKATALKIYSKPLDDAFPTNFQRVPGPKVHLNNQFSIHAVASCKCPQTRYWRYQRSVSSSQGNETAIVIDSYACAPLKRCKLMDFCGHVCSDSFSSYYQCSCPSGSLCLTQLPRTRVNVSELMYNGTAYKAICTPTQT